MRPNNENSDGSPNQQNRKARWIKITAGTLAVVLLFIGAALTWIVNDTERVRVVLERVVSTLTDRPFHIRGDFDFTLGSEVTSAGPRGAPICSWPSSRRTTATGCTKSSTAVGNPRGARCKI